MDYKQIALLGKVSGMRKEEDKFTKIYSWNYMNREKIT